MIEPCSYCEHRWIIQRRDGTGKRIICRSITQVRKHIAEMSDTHLWEIHEETVFYDNHTQASRA